MEWWNGFSPCTQLGVGDCVVWWDAWAVIATLLAACVAALALYVAWLTLIVGTGSTIAVWHLGRVANEANMHSAKIAESEAKARADHVCDEKLLILTLINLEMSEAATDVRWAVEYVLVDESPFVSGSLKGAFSELSRIFARNDYSVAQQLVARLHFLGRQLAGRVARILSVRTRIVASLEAGESAGTEQEQMAQWDYVRILIDAHLEDLAVVEEACVKAIDEMGISNSKARKAVDEWTEKYRGD